MAKYVTFLLKLKWMVNSLNFRHSLLVYERFSDPNRKGYLVYGKNRDILTWWIFSIIFQVPYILYKPLCPRDPLVTDSFTTSNALAGQYACIPQ